MNKISIIIPTYNRAEYIGQAISSVFEQTYTDWEIIVTDDASTDNTREIVEGFIKKDTRVRYMRQPQNVGISANRNTGIKNSTGVYIAMLDSDDIWLDKNKLADQVAFIEANPTYALVGTSLQQIDQTGTNIGKISFSSDNLSIRQKILSRNQFAQSSVLFSKKAAEECSIRPDEIYDASLVLNEDYDLWLRIGMKYLFANLPYFSIGYRVHTGSIIKSKQLLAARVHLALIKKYRHAYPGFFSALIKARLRILLAYF